MFSQMNLSTLVNSSFWQSQPTYRWEGAFAALYLMVITIATDVTVGQVLSAGAVFFSFRHMSVGARLEEAQERSETAFVDCYRKLTQYLVVKEALWITAFVSLEAWTALAGVPLFLLYPVWRRAYRRARNPI